MSNFKLNPKFKFRMFYIEKIQIFWMLNTEYQTQSNIHFFFKYLISNIWHKIWILDWSWLLVFEIKKNDYWIQILKLNVGFNILYSKFKS